MPTAHAPSTTLDDDVAYRAVQGRDTRFDGTFFVAVLSTGVYCRPSCPARTPRRENCRFLRSAAACVAAGFRACRRCRPDAVPGSRAWDLDADLADRAMRLISDGAVDVGGVPALAQRLAVSERQLSRVLVAQVGATPGQLARTRRAQVARMLLDQTALPMAELAFAAGFSSVRQFNEVMRAEFGAPPSALRRSGERPGAGPGGGPRAGAGPGTGTRASTRSGPRRPAGSDGHGWDAHGWDAHGSDAHGPDGHGPAPIAVRVRHAVPFDADGFWSHVAARAVPGLEEVDGRTVRRLVRGRGGPVTVEVTAAQGSVGVRLGLTSLGDLVRTMGRVRHWADLDAEPWRVDAVLAEDPLLAPLGQAPPGLRVPGTVDPAELALRTVIGQQVSVAAARTLTARLVLALGEAGPSGGLRLFPEPGAVAAAGVPALRAIGLTESRARTVVEVARALADGLDVGPGCDRGTARAALGAIPGVGPWTVEYVALRGMGDPDAFPAHDLVLRRAMGDVTAAEALRRADGWRPWRGYAAQHLWISTAGGAP